VNGPSLQVTAGVVKLLLSFQLFKASTRPQCFPPGQPSDDGAEELALRASPSFCELLSESVNDPIVCARNLGFLRP
jgi:hypothetical protein